MKKALGATWAERARAIRLLALDVDGILTDGTLHYDAEGREAKQFSVRDGLGIKLVQQQGILVALISGRASIPVQQRARELGIQWVILGRDDKLSALTDLCAELQMGLHEAAYMGDDLPDLAAVRAAGIGLTAADAVAPVLACADWVSRAPGGRGAVREACEMLLKARSQWQATLATFY
jgi:3-deoxy-D-manno-octulosonate 8-phosphate phosphatase (KDO 8-P phosphatase)